MINTSNCNAFQAAGCANTPPTFTVGEYPQSIAVDSRTHTVYVPTTAPARPRPSRCSTTALATRPTRPGAQPWRPWRSREETRLTSLSNPRTDTIDVATITSNGPDLISVFNGATCNATDTGGCDQTPATVAVGSSGDAPNNSSLELAVDAATNTIYAANTSTPEATRRRRSSGNSVYVINGATCDAANTTGCGQTPATVTLAANPPIGSNPFGIAVDQATDTIYTANIADGEHPGTVSVINGAICNGHDTIGCDQTPATAPAGFGANGIAIDQRQTRSTPPTSRTPASPRSTAPPATAPNATGCGDTRTEATVGDYPSSISVDPAVGTAYVANIEGVSVIALNH